MYCAHVLFYQWFTGPANPETDPGEAGAGLILSLIFLLDLPNLEQSRSIMSECIDPQHIPVVQFTLSIEEQTERGLFENDNPLLVSTP